MTSETQRRSLIGDFSGVKFRSRPISGIAEDFFFVNLCLLWLSLLLREFAAGVQVVPVHDRVEDEEVASFCLTAPEWVG